MNVTVDFAASELKRYLNLITGTNGEIALFVRDESENTGDIFAEKCTVCVRSGKGSISANRPRALLIGVYEFLRRLGCRFTRPGKDGEVIPEMKLEDVSAEFEFIPENRHRGITIEGAVSFENISETIDWSVKNGFNSYFTLFMNSYEFFNRWYEHIGNPFLKPEKLEKSTVEEYIKKIVAELKKRDMIYHAVGHGWTPAALGINCNGWSDNDYTLPPEKKNLLAEIGGKREFYKGIPLNTHLCYSNPSARKLIAESVVNYALTHPECDVLHVWLADDYNNACECENCRKKRMADWYVMILNDIDALLTEKDCGTKIAFLVYLELYWAPLTERFNNPDRFILMFAPIFRSYTRAFDAKNPEKQQLPYEINKMKYPADASVYVAFLNEWKKIFNGDSFDFDYHLMWDINRDFGGEKLAEVLHRDIRNLPELGLNGFLSCQVQRAFYPNGLTFYAMGRTLAAPLSFEEIKDEYYSAAFGKYETFAKDFYSFIEQNVSFAYMKEEISFGEAMPGFIEAKEYLAKLLDDFPCTDNSTPLEKESMEILRFAAENIYRLLNVLLMKANGEPREVIEKANEERKEFFNKNEMRFQPYADGFFVNMITGGIIDCQKTGIYAATNKED